MNDKKKFDYAIEEVSKGYSVIPAAENDNIPNVVEWAQFQNRAMTKEELLPYWKENPNFNIAIVTGSISGISVVDVDGKLGTKSLKEHGIELPDTFVVETPRGWHYYYKYTHELKTASGVLPNVDIRSDGGVVIAPGSTRDGFQYHALNDLPVTELKSIPSHFITDQKSRFSAARYGDPNPLPDVIHEGARNETLFQFGVYLRGSAGVSHQHCLEVMELANESRCTPPLNSTELNKIVRSIYSTSIEPRQTLPALSGSDISEEEVDWLLLGRVAKRKLTVITGFAGVGKSFMCMSIMAALSTGGELPDYSNAPKMNSLILLGEDGAADTLKPRMEALGANHDRYFAIPLGIEKMDLRSNNFISQIAEYATKKSIGLIVIDPILSFTPGLDPRGEVQVREILGNLKWLGEETGSSIIAVSHKNKDRKQSNALHRISGSQAFGAVARSVLEVVEDENNPGQMLVNVLKNNLAKKPPPLGFCINEDETGSGVVEWLGELDDEESIRPLRKRNTPMKRRAIEFLERELSGGPIGKSNLEGMAHEVGITSSTLRKAREEMGLVVTREGNKEGSQGSGGTKWALPSTPTQNNT